MRGCSARSRRKARGELDQNAVAGGFDDPAAMEGYSRIDQLAAELAEALERAFLVEPSQPRIARHIGGQNGGKLAGRVHSGSPAFRKPSTYLARCSGR
jgi:hypothetical protein